METELQIPQHIAIILDGNGRWAKLRGLPRTLGHKEGCKAVEQTVWDCGRLGVKYLTVYGFSTENWKRSSEEVQGLMTLFRFYMVRLLKIAQEQHVRVRVIGDRTKFDADIIEGLDKLENETKDYDGLTFVIAVNYGARDEMRRAMTKIAEEVKTGQLNPEDITEEVISNHLDTAGMPDPDLLIRTGSELRLSNYLLWQSAYTELYVTDVLWPDFNMEELQKAIQDYSKRHRKFGGIKEDKDEQSKS